jgi:hypothetical protein
VESVLGKEMPPTYRQASRSWQDFLTPDSEYYISPAHVLVAVRKVFGGQIDTDPCSDAKANESVKAVEFIDAENDGLQPGSVWKGRVYINPPQGMLNNDNIQVCPRGPGLVLVGWGEGGVVLNRPLSRVAGWPVWQRGGRGGGGGGHRSVRCGSSEVVPALLVYAVLELV